MEGQAGPSVATATRWGLTQLNPARVKVCQSLLQSATLQKLRILPSLAYNANQQVFICS